VEHVGRLQAAAQWARRYRVWAIVIAFVATVLLDWWGAVRGVTALIVPVVSCVFFLLPGIETFARNFRAGYRDEA